jgi:hypothetical protein
LSYYETKTLQRAKGILSCCGIKYAGRAWDVQGDTTVLYPPREGNDPGAILEALKRMEFAFRRVSCYNSMTEWPVNGRLEKFKTIVVKFDGGKNG